MQNTGWEFAGSETAGRLNLGTAQRVRPSASDGWSRQSGLYLLYAGVRRLPICTPAAAAVVWIASVFLPASVRWTVKAWSAGLLALAMALCSGAISWAYSKWQLTDRQLILQHGLLFRREVTIQRDNILSVEVETTAITGLFRCSRLLIRTALRRSKGDRLLLSSARATLLAGELMPSGAGRRHSYRAEPAALWLAAAGGEGLAAFCSAAASALSVLRDTAGIYAEQQLAGLIRTNGVIPGTALGFALVWILKIVHTRLTHAAMSISRSGQLLCLTRGAISRRVERMHLTHICAIDTRLSLPGLLYGRRSCSLLLHSGQRYPYLPPVDERRLRIESAVISSHGAGVCAVWPDSSGLAYAAGRWLCCLGVLPVISLLRRVMPLWNTTILALGLGLAFVLLWRALATTVCSSRAGVRLFTDCMEVTGVRRLTIHTLRIFRPHVGMIRITQGPINRAFGRCTVKVTPRGAGTRLSCIKLPFERALAACERMM